MRLINHKTRNHPFYQQTLDRLRAQRLRRDIQYRSKPILDALNSLRPLDRTEQSIDCHRVHDALLFQIVHLIFHEGLQWRYHDGQCLRKLSSHQCGQLKCDGFSAACRKDGEQGLVVNCRLNCLLLQIFSIVFPKIIISENLV